MRWIAPARRTVFERPDLLVPELHMLGWDHFHHAGLTLAGHRHDAWEICYIVRGSVEWWTGDALYEVHGGDVYLTRPRERHGGVDAQLHPCELFWMQIALPGRSPMTGLTRSETHALRRALAAIDRRTFRGSLAVRQAFERLLDHHRQPGDFAALAARSAVHDLLLGVIAAHRQQPNRPLRSARIERALQWMAEHLAEDFAIENVANVVGLSVGHFHDRFLQETGFTPADYHQRQRIRHARALLAGGDSPVTQIAMRLGFSSSQYFATVFRKLVGLTPKSYRRARLTRPGMVNAG